MNLLTIRRSLFVLMFAAPAIAAPPWTALIPFKRVDTDPTKSYRLTEDQGPWHILAASFAGPGAEKQAHDLVLELRRESHLPAYIHKQTYDYTESMDGLTLNKYGGRAKMKYANNAARYDSFAVLIGNYDSTSDPKLGKTLSKVKYLRPRTLDISQNQHSRQRFAGWRALQRRMNGDPMKRDKGPMGSAFATRNPLLSEEYFLPSGIDDFVIGMNKNVEFSILKNPGAFTVRVATFKGKETTNAREIEAIERTGRISNKLELAADRAHRLTMALREQGIEAYEFHDRYESIVTVGSFDSDGKELETGQVEINPGIHNIMKQFAATQQRLPGQQGIGLQPRRLNGVNFDVQPLPMRVPRRSIAMDYVRKFMR
ncbi:MAG: hypothetical protein QF918_00440 [Pirellulaceae bacterium]|nr:hypothetical protein [Pirellulaceae bacterium]